MVSSNERKVLLESLVLGGIVTYLILFFSIEPHRGWLLLPTIPDAIAATWFGGNWPKWGWFDRVSVLVIVVLQLAISYSLGRGVLHWLRVPPMYFAEQTAYAAGIGLSLISTYTLCTGLAGYLHSQFTMLAPLVFLSIASAIAWRRNPTRLETIHSPATNSLSTRIFFWIIGVFSIFMILGGLLPPWEFDVCEYHVQVPKEWFLAGQIQFLPHNIYGNMPLGAEMHSLLAMAMFWGDDAWWWGSLAGKTVSSIFSLLTACLVYSCGRRHISQQAGAVGALIYISIPWVSHVSMVGLIDGVVAFYVVGTIAALSHFFYSAETNLSATERTESAAPPVMTENKSLLILAGIMAGGATATKYPPLFMLVAPCAIWIAVKSTSWNTRVRNCLVFLAVTALFGGSWYVKNYLLTGNPTYPLAYSIFGGATRTPEKDHQFREAHRDKDGQGRGYTVVQLGRAAGKATLMSDWLSPMVIPLSIVGVWFRRKNGVVRDWALYAIAFYALWWALTHRIDRFWIPVLPILALCGGAGAAAFASSNWKLALNGLLIGWAILALAVVTSPNIEFNKEVRYFVPLSEMREPAPNAVHAWLNGRYASERASNGKSSMRVLLVGDALPFWLEPPALYNTCFDDCIFERLLRGKTREERLGALQEAGITHIFVYWREIKRYRDTYGFTDFVTTELVRGELVRDQKILEFVPLEFDRQLGELFEVRKE